MVINVMLLASSVTKSVQQKYLFVLNMVYGLHDNKHTRTYACTHAHTHTHDQQRQPKVRKTHHQMRNKEKVRRVMKEMFTIGS